MRRRILFAAISVMLLLTLVTGCSSLPGSAAKTKHEILRKSILGNEWQMYQIRLTLPSGAEYPVLLKLAEGDKADGYFYLEKGTNVDFTIDADSQVYKSANLSSGSTQGVSSDRFSFVASKSQGSTYSLQFSNPANLKAPVVIFLNVIYSVNGELYVPLETTPQTP